MFPTDVETVADRVTDAAKARRLTITTAESCTSGLLAAALTARSGSSTWFERGFVTYSNAAKTEMLDVPADLIDRMGAVSEAVARAMAEGARKQAKAGLAVSITGIAGPTGGSETKPVGLVHFAVAGLGETTHHEARFGDVGRDEVRMASVRLALGLLAERLTGDTPYVRAFGAEGP